ncbi:MAG TPA: toll/interleukin-1 receptor domain-containing protein [Pyrinomonadaceae bacterium]|jgi:hypothetical protein
MIFISYAKEDAQPVRDLASMLRTAGFYVWLDEQSLLPGQEWSKEIEKAIHNADIILACLSRRSVNKRGFFQKELRLALETSQELPGGHIYLIPVRLEEVHVPEELRHLQWVDMFGPGGFDKLHAAISHQLIKKEIQSPQKSRKLAVALDFMTITNPVALLQSLIIFQSTHEIILVGEHNLTGNEMLGHPSLMAPEEPMLFDLLDASHIKHLEKYHGYPADNLSLREGNLSLALRLLNFAVEEGFIKIERGTTNTSVSEQEIMEDEALGKLRERIKHFLDYGPGVNKKRSWEYGFYLIPAYNPAPLVAPVAKYDFSMCLKNGYHLVVDGDINALKSDPVFSTSLNVQLSLYQETINMVTPTKFYDYQKMIEIAGLFTKITDNVREAIARYADSKSLHWFIPHLLTTGGPVGSSSLAQLLYSTIKSSLTTERPNEKA